MNGENNGEGGMDEDEQQHEQLLFQEDNGQEHQQPEVLFLEDEYEQKCQLEDEEENWTSSLNDQVSEEEGIGGEEEQSLIVDNSIERIEAHKKDVFCLSLSKNERWLATGSEDDTAAVWDTTQKPIRQHLHIVGKHVDSVHCLAWNCSSDLLASGDMSGRIVCTLVKDSIETEPSTLIIEDCQSTSEQQQQQQMSDNQEEEEQENSFEHIRWLLWHPSANGILFAGSDDGSIWMWLVILNEANSLNVQQFKVFLIIQSKLDIR
ncbi:unnamed protein product [Meloidogyne enterolobii]|uniref:Uncharacterized protein n=2 Tax=Meloidogyne enterolobii TaxID=390850 RepID=A0ACB0Y3Y5_MELEN|nr:unnamed protein product [Meloidogyne enterolobii]